MSNLSDYFHEMRLFRSRMVSAKREYHKQVESLEHHKGSQFYADKVSGYEKEYAAKQQDNRQRAQNALVGVLSKMRVDASKNIVQQPTSDMVNVLSLLRIADKLTPTEVRLYAEQMRDCPLALRTLRQIAASHSIVVAEPDSESQLNRIAQLDNAAYQYVTKFNGEEAETLSTPTLNMIDRALHEEDFYRSTTDCKSADFAEDAFLLDFTGNTDRTGFEANASAAAPRVSLHFKDMDALLEYMDKQSEKEPPIAQTIIKDEILRNCPDAYGAAYRYYKATGEKIDINPQDEEGEAI